MELPLARPLLLPAPSLSYYPRPPTWQHGGTAATALLAAALSCHEAARHTLQASPRWTESDRWLIRIPGVGCA